MIKGKREQSKSIALKAKKESSDEECSTSMKSMLWPYETSRNSSKDEEDTLGKHIMKGSVLNVAIQIISSECVH
jgi:hypothetical protein